MVHVRQTLEAMTEMAGILANQIKFFEAGNQVKPAGQNAAGATRAWLKFLHHEQDDILDLIAEYKRYSFPTYIKVRSSPPS